MVCPKCGKEIEEGKLYCESCGGEVNIVPEFVPEIELSIEESLSGVAMDIKPDDEIEDSVELDIDTEIVEEAMEESEHDFDMGMSHKTRNRVTIVYIIILAVIVLGLLGYIGLMFYHDNSAMYQCSKGDEQFALGRNRQAVTYYKKAVDIEPSEIEYRVRLADCYLAMENIDMAVDVFKDMIMYDPTSPLPYAQIISIYEKYGDYAKIDEFLVDYASEDIQKQFVDYLAVEPEFSVPGGEYDEEITLALTNESAGTIYYTTDGTMPDEASEVFTEPFVLKKGSHKISALFKNEYGVCSSIVSQVYTILPGAPDEPIISLDSGSYDVPELITVIIPAGCSVYYTVDGEDPTRTSRIYGEPIPLEEGISHYKFVAINRDNVASEIVVRDYDLNVNANFNSDEGLSFLYQYLANKHYIKDISGASEYYPGIFSYLYKDMRNINGVSLYCYNEYYVYGTGARAMTNNTFGVDMTTGEVYLVKRGPNDTYTLSLF